MGLKIFTTGIEQYAPGGTARVKALVIGGPGVGKTRSSSYWPKPFYADCEGGLASVADRRVTAAEIGSSQDMLDLLTMMKQECRKPQADRRWETLVIDTLDAFQRKVKDEWLQAHPNAGSFTGFDAWGYLDAKMQMLMTRLLNLDMNIFVAVHFTDKTITEGTGENAKQRQEYQLQLSGSIKDQVFNDFDLVGWMGKYYEAVDGQRVEKRGLTFKATPDKPFLKDRLNVTPPWLEITFAPEDYTNLWLGIVDRLDDIGESEVIGEVPSTLGETSSDVVTPEQVATSTLPPVDPKDIPLAQWDKPTLAKLAKDEGVTHTVDGQPIKGNTLKGELVAAIEKHRADAKAQAEASQPAPEAPAEAPAPEETTPAPAEASTPAEPDAPATAPDIETTVANGETLQVDKTTGVVETVEVTPEEGLANVEQVLGGTPLIDNQPAAEPVAQQAPAPTPTPAAPAGGDSPGVCESCGKDLAGENQNFVKLSKIKFRKKLCEGCYQVEKAKKG